MREGINRKPTLRSLRNTLRSLRLEMNYRKVCKGINRKVREENIYTISYKPNLAIFAYYSASLAVKKRSTA